MKKGTLVTIIVLAVVAIVAIAGVKQYNALVLAEENVETAWSQVENQYQRRADLIPNLVATVKAYAAHESETLTAVVEMRAKATQVIVDANNLTAEQFEQFQQAQGALSSALGKLLAVQENYPDLKANENFLALQGQLEGTENRITVARNAFNEAAQLYNVQVRKFPMNIIAGMFGFEKKPYFAAKEGTDVAPQVAF